MPVTGVLHKLSFGGRLFVDEMWSCSIHVLTSGGSPATAEDLAPAVAAWLSNAPSSHSNAAALDFVKFNVLDPATGKYASPGQADTFIAPGTTIGTGSPAAGQISCAISLTTPLARGRGHIGRIYAPSGLTWASVTATGQSDSINRVALANATAVLIN